MGATPVMLDLFSGLGGASAAMRDRGWHVVTVDIESKFSPDHVADILHWSYDGPPVDFLWASPPCTEFSRDGLPWLRGRYPSPSLDLVRATLALVAGILPKYWAMENVRSAIRHITPVVGRGPIQVGSAFIWGDFPHPGQVLVPPHKEKLPSRRRAERCKLPYAISHAIALACESDLFFRSNL